MRVVGMGGKGRRGRREKEEAGCQGHGKEEERGRANKWGNVVGIQKRRIEELEENSGIWIEWGTLMRGVRWTVKAMEEVVCRIGGVQRGGTGMGLSVGPRSWQGWMSPRLHACRAMNK